MGIKFRIQDQLRKKLVIEDDFSWEFPSTSSSSSSSSSSSFVDLEGREKKKEVLKYVGGVDISFLKEDPSIACGSLVVLEFDSLNLLYHDFSVEKINVPYVPGFLAFREVFLFSIFHYICNNMCEGSCRCSCLRYYCICKCSIIC